MMLSSPQGKSGSLTPQSHSCGKVKKTFQQTRLLLRAPHEVDRHSSEGNKIFFLDHVAIRKKTISVKSDFMKDYYSSPRLIFSNLF
jgi:hypothetical protein